MSSIEQFKSACVNLQNAYDEWDSKKAPYSNYVRQIYSYYESLKNLLQSLDISEEEYGVNELRSIIYGESYLFNTDSDNIFHEKCYGFHERLINVLWFLDEYKIKSDRISELLLTLGKKIYFSDDDRFNEGLVYEILKSAYNCVDNNTVQLVDIVLENLTEDWFSGDISLVINAILQDALVNPELAEDAKRIITKYKSHLSEDIARELGNL
jgi:hypothetical protein